MDQKRGKKIPADESRARARERARAFLGTWSTQTSLLYAVERDDIVMVVQVAPNPAGSHFAIIALETGKDAQGVQGVMDHHAHELVAERIPSLRVAVQRAEAYARAWLRRPRGVVAPCDCAPIAKRA